MRNFRIFAAIADIHIGIKHISAEEMKHQLKNRFIKPIRKLRYLDGIFILGDLMHTIVSLNSEYAELMNWFIDQIYKEARRRNNRADHASCVVIVLKGTISHDNDQLNNIKHYCLNDDGVDFRVYENPSSDVIWENQKILILPDVRVKRKNEILELLHQDTYDLILGHGLIDKMQFFVQESEQSPMKTVVYDSDDLMNHCNGPILFGHIHQFQHIDHQFYYTGPFTLLERGTTNPGFLIGGIMIDDTHKYRIEHYQNDLSPQYHDWVISRELLETYDGLELMNAIDELLEETGPHDLIRLKITRGDELSSADKVAMIESRYRNDKRIAIAKKIKTKQEEDRVKLSQEKRSRFSYILSKDDLSDILFRYFQEEVRPTITEPSSPLLSLTREDFERALRKQI